MADHQLPKTDNGKASSQPAGERMIALSKLELSLIIDALLQVEAALAMNDQRHGDLPAVEHLRKLQVSLAQRLEDHLGALAH